MSENDETPDLDVVGLILARDLRPQVVPPSEVRARLLARIAGEQEGFGFVTAGEGEWKPLLPGIRFKVLSYDATRQFATVLFEGAPGSEFPSHAHSAAEHCYVLSGDFIVCGRTLGPGDFHHAAAGTVHPPSRTIGGCTLLIVAAAEDYVA